MTQSPRRAHRTAKAPSPDRCSGSARPALSEEALFDELRERIVAGPLALVLHWRGEALREITLRWNESAPDLPPAALAATGGGRDDARDGAPVGTWMDPAATSTGPVTPHGRAMQAALEGYVAGAPAQWPQLPLLMDGMSPFTREVLTILRNDIGHGRITTYAGLAALAGRPAAARGVGQIMARNPWPLVVPCHRVLAGSGRNLRLNGFSGAGLPMKRWLLQLEGAIDHSVKD